MCHDVTEVSRPVKGLTLIYLGRMMLFNFTGVSESCSALKKYREQELVKTIWTINGLRLCDDFKKGVRCYEGKIFKYRKINRTFSLVSMTVKDGDMLRVHDKITFENGKESCTDVNIVAMKF